MIDAGREGALALSLHDGDLVIYYSKERSEKEVWGLR